MNIVQISLLSFSLSLDCFAISISQGLRKNNSSKSHLYLLAFLFGLFQAFMFLIGYFTGNLLLGNFKAFANVISSALLIIIGLKMIKEGFDKDEESENPTNFKEYLYLSIATSIDALAAGVSFIKFSEYLVIATTLIGITSLIMSIIGSLFGKYLGTTFGKKSEIFGGFILIYLGIKVFY